MELSRCERATMNAFGLAMLLMTTVPAHGQMMERVSRHYSAEPKEARNLAPVDAQSLVVMLGTGTPLPTPHRFGPATAIIVNGQPYIVDAGEGVMARPSQSLSNSLWPHRSCVRTHAAY